MGEGPRKEQLVGSGLGKMGEIDHRTKGRGTTIILNEVMTRVWQRGRAILLRKTCRA